MKDHIGTAACACVFIILQRLRGAAIARALSLRDAPMGRSLVAEVLRGGVRKVQPKGGSW